MREEAETQALKSGLKNGYLSQAAQMPSIGPGTWTHSFQIQKSVTLLKDIVSLHCIPMTPFSLWPLISHSYCPF